VRLYIVAVLGRSDECVGPHRLQRRQDDHAGRSGDHAELQRGAACNGQSWAASAVLAALASNKNEPGQLAYGSVRNRRGAVSPELDTPGNGARAFRDAEAHSTQLCKAHPRERRKSHAAQQQARAGCCWRCSTANAFSLSSLHEQLGHAAPGQSTNGRGRDANATLEAATAPSTDVISTHCKPTVCKGQRKPEKATVEHSSKANRVCISVRAKPAAQPNEPAAQNLSWTRKSSKVFVWTERKPDGPFCSR